MIGYYNLSVIATYFSLLCSIFGMASAMMGHAQTAFILLMLCGLCDMIDGPIARKCKRTEEEKSFGIQIDSLCDLVCFGAQPAVLTLCMAGVTWYASAVVALFVLAGVIRLGYFNVQEMIRVQTDPGRRKTYDGLPITSSALILPFVSLVDIAIRPACGWIYVIACAVTGFLYILPVHIPKLHTRGMILCGLCGVAMFVLILVFGGALTAV